MKKLLYILIALLLLTGCTANSPETTVPETTAAPTEPPVPWIQELGMPWDEEGTLVELPLTIPNGLHYDNVRDFDGDLLLWSIDEHLENIHTLELCLVDLDTGKVAAQRDFPFVDFVNPQVLRDALFLCDSQGGTILELNKNLEAVNTWKIDPMEAYIRMGAGEKLYIYQWDGTIQVLDLATGEKKFLMDEDIYIEYFSPAGEMATIEYYHPVTGEQQITVLNLITGELMDVALDKNFTYVSWRDGTWLCETYRDGSIMYIGDDSGNFLRADMGHDTLRLVDGDTLLHTWEDGTHVSLHDVTGKSLARAKLTATPYSLSPSLLIPSDTFGGYFLIIGDYETAQRLLYWDISRGEAGDDILFEPIPAPGEEEAWILQRVEELELTYGLNILVGQEAGGYFYDFEAELVTDPDDILDALDTLEDALAVYPEGFFRQLRYGDIRRTEIHLMGTLTATNSEYVDTYEAFVQNGYDCHTMVMDIYLSDETTYFHEFSHIIDSFLEWDALNREDALFSEETWDSLNPDWFPGYTWDYSWEQYVEDYSCFVDSYSTINPTEDRARVLEYAMADYGQWTFEEAPTLISKLEYYCLCIRDAFDTTGWPEELPWEQYLP